jgi:hypothetical protein
MHHEQAMRTSFPTSPAALTFFDPAYMLKSCSPMAMLCLHQEWRCRRNDEGQKFEVKVIPKMISDLKSKFVELHWALVSHFHQVMVEHGAPCGDFGDEVDCLEW